MNPRISYTIDFFKLKPSFEPEIAFIEYKDGEVSASVSFMSPNPDVTDPHPISFLKEVSLNKYAKLSSNFTSLPISVGTDKKSLYESDSHRKIIYSRFILPQGLWQVDFEDESENGDISKNISEFMRSLWQVV